jgi:hypothetical protein
MLAKYLLVEYRILSLTVLIALSIEPGGLRGADLTIETRSNSQQTLEVSLINKTNENFFALLGGLCKGYGAPAFRFVLRRDGQPDEAMYLDYNVGNDPVICGNPDPWLVFMPTRSRFDFTFFLTEIRFLRHTKHSLADVTGAYHVDVTYGIDSKSGLAALTAHHLAPDTLVWRGRLTATLFHP